MRSTPVKIGVSVYKKRLEAVMAMKACESKYPHKPPLTIQEFWDEQAQTVRFRIVPLGK